jgi:hypothetical protein
LKCPLVTYKADGVELADGLAQILDQANLAYRVIDNRMLIIKNSDKRLRGVETYNVRGLLTEKLDIESMISLIKETDELSVSIKAIDEHRMVVTASAVDQRRVGKILGALAKPSK